MKKGKKILIIVLLAAVGAGLYYRYGRTEEEVTYITEKVVRQDIRRVVNATGEVKAMDLVTVGAQASGKIEKLHVVVGQDVREGDLIAEIDSTTQQNDININKAKLTSYEAQLAAAKISLEIAKKQYVRTQALRREEAASQEDLENAEDDYALAESKVIEIQASIEETRISLSTAETNLGYTKITAPLNGTIVSVPVKQGQTVNAAMNTPTIVQIADLDKMEILLEISEGDIANVQPGQRVTYSILADLGNMHETTLKSIDPGLTLLTNGEYTEVVDASEAIYYYGRLAIDNQDRRLRIGMTTQSVIEVAVAERVLTVPSMAVKDGVQGKYVEVRTAQGVLKQQVATGITDGLNVEIVSGISEGEQVVMSRLSSSEIAQRASNVEMRAR